MVTSALQKKIRKFQTQNLEFPLFFYIFAIQENHKYQEGVGVTFPLLLSYYTFYTFFHQYPQIFYQKLFTFRFNEVFIYKKNSYEQGQKSILQALLPTPQG